jgi:hypothetical protein
MPESRRKDKIELDPDLVAKLYKDCDGWVQRMHEILTEGLEPQKINAPARFRTEPVKRCSKTPRPIGLN